MKNINQLTDEEIDYIERYYLTKTDYEVSKYLDVKESTVKRIRYKYDWKKQRQTSNKELFNKNGEKWCWYCNTYHDISWFNKNKNKPSGYQDECKIGSKQMTLKRKYKKQKNEEIDIERKICEECGQELSIEMFIKNVSTKDGYSNKCKECMNEDLDRKYKINK